MRKWQLVLFARLPGTKIRKYQQTTAEVGDRKHVVLHEKGSPGSGDLEADPKGR